MLSYLVTIFAANSGMLNSELMDKEPYVFGNKVKLDEVVKSIEDYVLLTSTETINDNSDQNRVGEDLTGGENNNGKSASSVLGFEIQDGKIKISEWNEIGVK